MLKTLKTFCLLVILSVSGLAHAQTQQDQTFSTADGDNNQICAIRTSGELVCRTRSTLTRLLPPDNLPQFVSVTTGSFHACGLTVFGQVQCWGDNDFGQIDSPTDTVFDVIEAGPYHTCGIDLEGQVQCWGRNDSGESTPQFFESNYDRRGSVAVSTDIDSSGHPSVSQPSPIVSLDLDSFGSCGLDTQNIIRCWGTTNSNFDPNRLAGNNSTVIGFAVSRDNSRTIAQVALMQDGSTRAPIGYERLNDFGQRYSQLAALDDEICGLRLDGVVVCQEQFPPTNRSSRAALLAELNDGEPLQSLVGGSFALCGLTAGQNLRCLTLFSRITAPGVALEPIAAPQDFVAEVYDRNTIELFWAPDAVQLAAIQGDRSDAFGLDAYQWDIAGSEIYRDDELLATTTAFSSYLDNTLEAGRTYDYRVRYILHDRTRESIFSNTISVNTAPLMPSVDENVLADGGSNNNNNNSNNSGDNGVSVVGQTISWLDDGWYQVQSAVDYTEVCGGGTSCEVSPGTYVVINHSSGIRSEGIVVGGSGDVVLADNSDGANTGDTNTGIEVTGNTISWPDDGWYQVQNEADYAEVCGGGISCDVSPGTYVVINHTTGVRFGGVVVR